MATMSTDNKFHCIISGGQCTSGCRVDLQAWWNTNVSSYGIASGAEMYTGIRCRMEDIVVHGGLLYASDTQIRKLNITDGRVALTGSAKISSGLVGGRLEMVGISLIDGMSVVCGGCIQAADKAWLRDITICSGGTAVLQGETSANALTLSSGARLRATADCDLSKLTIHSGASVELHDRVHVDDLWLEEGAELKLHDHAEIIYHRATPAKLEDAPVSSAVISSGSSSESNARYGNIPLSMTLLKDGALQINIPREYWPPENVVLKKENK